MRRIILDTNFLLIPLQFKVDIFSEFERICKFHYKLCILSESIRELEGIKENQKGKSKLSAVFALKLVKLKNIHVIETEKGYVDSLILDNAKKEDIVATQDAELRRSLAIKGVSVIHLRSRQFLEIVERNH